MLRIFHSGPVDAWRERERALRRRGHRVRLLAAAAWNEGGSPVTLRAAPDEDVIPVRAWGQHPNLFVYDPRPLWRSLTQPWDVLDVHEEPVSLAVAEIRLLAAAARWRGPMTLYSAQNIAKRYPIPFRWLQASALRAAAGLSACNKAAAEYAVSLGLAGNAKVIPLGVDPDTFSPAPEALRVGVVGYVGRFEPHKGVLDLLAAAERAQDLTVEFVGAGSLGPQLRQRADTLGHRVRVLGPMDQRALPDFYRSIDVLAVPSVDTPSWREQFGRVVIEAMACGTPVVASDGGALPEVVGDGGIIVPQNDPETLTEVLVSLIADRERRSRYADAARARALGCSWDAVAAAYEDLYTAAMNHTPAHAATDTDPSGPAVPVEQAVNVAIVAYGRPELLAETLAGLEGFPITIVDNSSSPQIAALARSHDAAYIDPGSNLGFAAAVNVALTSRRPGTDVLLLNPDARLSAADLAVLHGHLTQDPSIAAVAPAQVDGGGRSARVSWPFPTPGQAWLDAIGAGRWTRRTGFLIGSVLLLSGRALSEVGGFDERFFLYAEETDWQRRAVDRGWRLELVEEVIAVHHGAATSTDEELRTARFHAGQELYLRKHHGPLGWQLARTGRITGAGVRALVRTGPRRQQARRDLAVYLRGPRGVLHQHGVGS